MVYYMIISGQQVGPYPKENLIARGLTPDTLVWCEGMADWQKASSVSDLLELFAPQSPAPGFAPAAGPAVPPMHPGAYGQPFSQAPERKYHVILNGVQSGPFTVSQLAGMGLTPATQVWTEGMPAWAPASTVPELAPYLSNFGAGTSPAAYHQNWYGLAVTATVVGALFSCIGLVFGIIAINKATTAKKFYDIGDNINGDAANSSAKSNTIIAFVLAGIGLIVNIITFANAF